MWQRQWGNCPACQGSGIGKIIFHGYEKDGSECLEPMRCEKCDGFGSIDSDGTATQAQNEQT